jgi:hypothetical protein
MHLTSLRTADFLPNTWLSHKYFLEAYILVHKKPYENDLHVIFSVKWCTKFRISMLVIKQMHRHTAPDITEPALWLFLCL